MEKISIKGLDKYKVLAALYNNSKPQGLGFLHFTPEPLSDQQAREGFQAIEKHYQEQHLFPVVYSFDYLKGRVLKVNLTGDEFSPQLYDQDNGPGAAKRAIDSIR